MLSKDYITKELLKAGYKERFILKVINKIHEKECNLARYTEIIQEIEQEIFDQVELRKEAI